MFNADTSQAALGHVIEDFSWNFGDGTTGTGGLTSHTYTQAGTYVVTLSVFDDTGQKATVQQTVTVGTGDPSATFTISTCSASRYRRLAHLRR